MNGNTYEITWKQGSMEHSAWTTNEDDARFLTEALKLHPPVEAVRVVSLISKWERPAKAMRSAD